MGVWRLAVRWFLVLGSVVATPRAGETGHPDWNNRHAGRSYAYKELDLDTLLNFVSSEDKDVIISFYGDRCTHCQEIHPMQEKGASRVLAETKSVLFGRIDAFRFGGTRVVANHFHKHYPDFAAKSLLKPETLEVPQMWLFKKGMKGATQVPHGEIGWGNSGWKTLRNWVRQNVNDGKGYDWKSARKAIKAAKRTVKKEEKGAKEEAGEKKEEKKEGGVKEEAGETKGKNNVEKKAEKEVDKKEEKKVQKKEEKEVDEKEEKKVQKKEEKKVDKKEEKKVQKKEEKKVDKKEEKKEQKKDEKKVDKKEEKKVQKKEEKKVDKKEEKKVQKKTEKKVEEL